MKILHFTIKMSPFTVALILDVVFFGYIHSTKHFHATNTRYRPCVDNSDCANLGHAYACFLYMCYPWEQPDSKEHPSCSNDMDCWEGQGQCKRDDG